MSARDKCYSCVHRRDVPGSAHSSCYHPAAEAEQASEVAAVVRQFGKRTGKTLLPTRASIALHIEGARPGIHGGWFLWPFNFDPVWLERCDGYQATVQAVEEATR